MFRKKKKATKVWHKKALLVDPHRTKITLASTTTKKEKHLPPWLHKKRKRGEL